MSNRANKIQETKAQPASAMDSQTQSGGESTFQFVDNRPKTLVQRRLQDMANNSLKLKQVAQLQAMTDNYLARQHNPIQKKENDTGLPDNLKSGIENLSGYSMNDVKVHYNSDKPTQLNAHAYAQGTDIHIASGQEKHLPHEAWHVVQQKQGRVKPTIQMKGGVNVNDDVRLENEADVMGKKALQANSLPKAVSQGNPYNSSSNSSDQTEPLRQIINFPEVRQLFGLTVGGGQEAFEIDTALAGDVTSADEEDDNRVQLADLGDETLFVLGHGIPALGNEPPKVDVYNPTEFVEMLVALGYDPGKHTGSIDFKSCTAGWARTKDGSFIEQVKVLLSDRGYNGQIRGVEGFALAIPQDEIPVDNRVAEADENNIGRYQDFGIFRQWRTWKTFLEQVILKKIEDLTEDVDEQIAVVKELMNDLETETINQMSELSRLLETSEEAYRTGIVQTKEAIAKSGDFWFKKFLVWKHRGVSQDDRDDSMMYVVISLEPVNTAITEQIDTYRERAENLKPLPGYTNVPARPEVANIA